jgi:hypothetical protein
MVKRKLRVESKKTFNEPFREDLVLKMAKRSQIYD